MAKESEGRRAKIPSKDCLGTNGSPDCAASELANKTSHTSKRSHRGWMTVKIAGTTPVVAPANQAKSEFQIQALQKLHDRRLIVSHRVDRIRRTAEYEVMDVAAHFFLSGQLTVVHSINRNKPRVVAAGCR